MIVQEAIRSFWENMVSSLSRNVNGRLERDRVVHLKRDIEEAKRDWQYACSYFDVVTEPDLVDHAIYMMHAAEVRYVYMLKQLRRKRHG